MKFPKQTAILNRYRNTCASELKQTVLALHYIQCNKIAMMLPLLNRASIKKNVEKTTQTAEAVASAHQQLAAQLVLRGRSPATPERAGEPSGKAKLWEQGWCSQRKASNALASV